MMNQQKSLLRIAELLSRFKVEVAILNSNAQLDINIISEDILIPILNILYKANFKNAKYSEINAQFPALDLLDKSKKIAIQITSTSNIDKIKKTLEGVVKNKFYNDFEEFYIYIITQKQKSYDNRILEKSTEGLFKFKSSDILDEKDLYQKIASLPFEDILNVQKLLEQQFSDLKKEEKIQSDLSKIIGDLKLDYQKITLALEIEGIYKARKGWIEKKVYLESKLPLISDFVQEFSILKQIEEINTKVETLNANLSELVSTIN